MKKIKWNYETAKKESLKYKSRGEFVKEAVRNSLKELIKLIIVPILPS